MSKCNVIKNRIPLEMSYTSLAAATLGLVASGGMIYAAATDDAWMFAGKPTFDNIRSKFGKGRGLSKLKAENGQVLTAFVSLFIACLLFWFIGFTTGAYMYDGKRRVSEAVLKDLQAEGAKAAEKLI